MDFARKGGEGFDLGHLASCLRIVLRGAVASAPDRGWKLICINSRAAEPADGVMMTPSPVSPIRHCPVCGIAMQASKSREDLAKVDTYRCLTCDTTIRESAVPATDSDTRAER
jgi:hypothetical protein